MALQLASYVGAAGTAGTAAVLGVLFASVVGPVRLQNRAEVRFQECEAMEDAVPWKGDTALVRGFDTCSNNGSIVLSFDDGPITGNTEAILDSLDQIGAKAIFFVSPLAYGSVSEKALDEKCRLVCKIIQRGHEVGCHSYDHPDFNTISSAEAARQIEKASLWVKRCGGVRPQFFRPPFGALQRDHATLATALGYTNAFWNLDSRDWSFPGDFENIMARIEAAHEIYKNRHGVYRSSIILLLHEQSSITRPDLFEAIVELFSEYTFVSMKECYSRSDSACMSQWEETDGRSTNVHLCSDPYLPYSSMQQWIPRST